MKPTLFFLLLAISAAFLLVESKKLHRSGSRSVEECPKEGPIKDLCDSCKRTSFEKLSGKLTNTTLLTAFKAAGEQFASSVQQKSVNLDLIKNEEVDKTCVYIDSLRSLLSQTSYVKAIEESLSLFGKKDGTTVADDIVGFILRKAGNAITYDASLELEFSGQEEGESDDGKPAVDAILKFDIKSEDLSKKRGFFTVSRLGSNYIFRVDGTSKGLTVEKVMDVVLFDQIKASFKMISKEEKDLLFVGEARDVEMLAPLKQLSPKFYKFLTQNLKISINFPLVELKMKYGLDVFGVSGYLGVMLFKPDEAKQEKSEKPEEASKGTPKDKAQSKPTEPAPEEEEEEKEVKNHFNFGIIYQMDNSESSKRFKRSDILQKATSLKQVHAQRQLMSQRFAEMNDGKVEMAFGGEVNMGLLPDLINHFIESESSRNTVTKWLSDFDGLNLRITYANRKFKIDEDLFFINQGITEVEDGLTLDINYKFSSKGALGRWLKNYIKQDKMSFGLSANINTQHFLGKAYVKDIVINDYFAFCELNLFCEVPFAGVVNAGGQIVAGIKLNGKLKDYVRFGITIGVDIVADVDLKLEMINIWLEAFGIRRFSFGELLGGVKINTGTGAVLGLQLGGRMTIGLDCFRETSKKEQKFVGKDYCIDMKAKLKLDTNHFDDIEVSASFSGDFVAMTRAFIGHKDYVVSDFVNRMNELISFKEVSFSFSTNKDSRGFKVFAEAMFLSVGWEFLLEAQLTESPKFSFKLQVDRFTIGDHMVVSGMNGDKVLARAIVDSSNVKDAVLELDGNLKLFTLEMGLYMKVTPKSFDLKTNWHIEDIIEIKLSGSAGYDTELKKFLGFHLEGSLIYNNKNSFLKAIADGMRREVNAAIAKKKSELKDLIPEVCTSNSVCFKQKCKTDEAIACEEFLPINDCKTKLRYCDRLENLNDADIADYCLQQRKKCVTKDFFECKKWKTPCSKPVVKRTMDNECDQKCGTTKRGMKSGLFSIYVNKIILKELDKFMKFYDHFSQSKGGKLAKKLTNIFSTILVLNEGKINVDLIRDPRMQAQMSITFLGVEYKPEIDLSASKVADIAFDIGKKVLTKLKEALRVLKEKADAIFDNVLSFFTSIGDSLKDLIIQSDEFTEEEENYLMNL